MPEPTDHRAGAEKWLELAGDSSPVDGVMAAALIGIGHALLAHADRPQDARTATQDAGPTDTTPRAGAPESRQPITFAGEPVWMTPNQIRVLEHMPMDMDHPWEYNNQPFDVEAFLARLERR